MTSKDIIIHLIDNKSITGEEAYVLLNDVLKGEMVAVNEILKSKLNPYTTGISIPPVWNTAATSASAGDYTIVTT